MCGTEKSFLCKPFTKYQRNAREQYLERKSSFKNYIKRVEHKLSTSVEMQRFWNILQNLKAMTYKHKLPFNNETQTALF